MVGLLDGDGMVANPIVPSKGRFAHVASAVRLAVIYVPFVDHTDARSVAGCGTDDCAE